MFPRGERSELPESLSNAHAFMQHTHTHTSSASQLCDDFALIIFCTSSEFMSNLGFFLAVFSTSTPVYKGMYVHEYSTTCSAPWCYFILRKTLGKIQSIFKKTRILEGNVSHLKFNLLSKYLKSTQGLAVLVVRGTCYQY